MGDHHGHHHSHSYLSNHAGSRAISKAIWITIVLMIVELLGGWFSNSLALVSDAAHMLTDVGAMLLSLFAFWVARKPTTPTMSYGYHRAEILGALMSGLMIWLIAGILTYEAIARMQSPPEVKGPVVFVVATLGLAANIFSMWLLSSAQKENLNVRAAYLHLFSDSLGSIGAIIAGAVLWLTDWRPIDPIMTILFSGLMLYSSWSLVKEAVSVLMESAPTHLDPAEIQSHLASLSGVVEVHDLHVWSVSSGKLALSVHLITRENDHQLLNQANTLLQEKFNIIHTTVQVEHADQFQSARCYDCVPVEMKKTS